MKKIFFAILISCCSVAFALQGGPSQPDYIQFEPANLQDMVNLQTGNFTYSIPLGELPGPYGNFPLSMSYHAGITPQQEASWVGLGWTLNPGAINRDQRGVPDDQFHGGTLGFVYQYAAWHYWNLNFGYGYGAFSVGLNASSSGGIGLSYSVGFQMGDYASVGFTVSEESFGVSASVGGLTQSLGGGLTQSLAVSMKDGSLSGSTSLSLGAKNVSASIGASYGQGRKTAYNVGFSVSGQEDVRDASGKVSGTKVNTMTVGLSSNGVSVSGTQSLYNGQGKFQSKSGGEVSVNVSNSTVSGNGRTSTKGFSLFVPTPFGNFSLGFNDNIYEYRMRAATSDYVYGYMYQAGPAIIADGENNVAGMPKSSIGSVDESLSDMKWSWTLKGRTLEKLGDQRKYPAYDIFNVSSEGASGSFRLFPREEHQIYELVSDLWTVDNENVETYSPLTYGDENKDYKPFEEEFKIVDKKNVKSEYASYEQCLNEASCSPYALYATNIRNEGNRFVYRKNKNGVDTISSGLNFLFIGDGGYYETSDMAATRKNTRKQVPKELVRKTIGDRQYALYGSRKIEPIFEDDSPVGTLKGFIITASNGNKYIFGQPVKSYLKVDYSINKEKGVPVFVDQSTSISASNFFADFADGYWEFLKGVYTIYFQVTKSIVNFFTQEGHLDEACKSGADDKEKVDDVFFSYQVNMNPYATQWLLTEIQGADYIDLGNDKSIGYDVKFYYSTPSVYRWRTPYARPGLSGADLPNFRAPTNGFTPEGCDSRMYQASFGVKEYVYLDSITTSTHKVVFNLNDPETEERIDGKGWEKGLDPENGYSDIPIFVQANLLGKAKKVDKAEYSYKKKYCVAQNNSCYSSVGGEKLEITPEYLYFSTPVPEKIRKVIESRKIITVTNFNKNSLPDGRYDEEEIKKTTQQMANFDKGEYALKLDENAEIEVVNDKNSIYGVYRVKLSKENDKITANSFVDESYDGKEIVLGESGVGQVYPLVEWSNIIFDKSYDEPGANQSRYLKSIAYYNKNDKDHPYQVFDFNYDYSLQPKTLNSYCSGRYPVSNDDISNSPDTAGVDACNILGDKNYLYGKLTLKSISEKGCRNGKCSYLPPFKFEYNSPSLTSSRLSTIDGWMELSQQVLKSEDGVPTEFQYPDEYYDNLSDVDASIVASSNTVDDWGMWNIHANSENHKVDQTFADYGASAWSLNKVTDPAGGIMEVSYERDSYQNGEDFASEKRYVEIVGFNRCSEYGDDYEKTDEENYKDKLCVEIGELYWREECLGPREAFWDTKKPMGYQGSGFEYLDSMGIDVKSGKTHVMLNLTSATDTEVDCGPFGWGSCDRTRNVAVVTEGAVVGELDSKRTLSPKRRLIVIDNDFTLIDAGLVYAAYKINRDDNDWNPANKDRKGFMWSRQEYEEMKGGDLRVKQISRIDIDRTTRTEYEYAPGEIALLPDSAFTTVMGNRFYGNKVSFALPNVSLKPKSRIVGFDDDDLLYLPGSSVSYPMVTVKNTDTQGKALNGKTVFKYITPESGVPKEFIDPATLSELKPFVKVNALLFNFYGNDSDKDYDYRSFYAEIELLDDAGHVLDRAKHVLIAQNKSNSYMFYAKDIKNAKCLKVSVTYREGEKPLSGEINLADGEETLTDYNEFSVALNLNLSKKNLGLTLEKMWFRSHKEGFIPVLYRTVSYGDETFELQEIGKNTELSGSALFEQSVTYHDFSSFLGLNYEIDYYRGNDDKAIKIKNIKNVYSTKAPSVALDVADNNEDIENKVGVQREKWRYETQLHCTDDDAGDDDLCMTKYAPLYERTGSNRKDHGRFEYVRYPAFLISTKTSEGFDNQDGRGQNLFTVASMDNHRFDPLTGLPTASVARTVISRENNGKKVLEMRKLTVKQPHYFVKENGKTTELANKMFLKNMFTQNYYDAIYSGTVDSTSSWNSIEKKDSLRSFSFSPFRVIPDSLYEQEDRPIVAWGSYSSKKQPKSYLDNDDLTQALARYQNAQKKMPDLKEFNGTHILSVDSNLKIVETIDLQDRVLSSHYSSDGMYQTSLFFPAKIAETASIVPVGRTVAVTNCEVGKPTVDLAKGGIILTSSPTCTVKGSDLIIEYRAFIKGSWKSVHEEYKSSSMSSLKSGVILNYLRIYPSKAESKTFITDNYGNIAQIVAEDNTSTYYEYDPSGSLVQVRNDDGVSYKSHHREFRNDTLNSVDVKSFIRK